MIMNTEWDNRVQDVISSAHFAVENATKFISGDKMNKSTCVPPQVIK